MPVSVPASIRSAAASTGLSVKGLITGMRRSRVTFEKRTSSPAPTARRSASLKATVGFTAKPPRAAFCEMYRPLKRSGSAHSVFSPKGTFTPIPKATRGLNGCV